MPVLKFGNPVSNSHLVVIGELGRREGLYVRVSQCEMWYSRAGIRERAVHLTRAVQ